MQMLSGYPAIMSYSTSILITDPKDKKAAALATVFIGMMSTLAVVIFSFIVDRITAPS